MTKAPDIMGCPVCGTELVPAQIFASEEAQRAFARLAAVSLPIGARVMNYVTLFAPPKTRLTVAKQVKLILQLLPDLERQAITHNGRDWPAPLAAWSAAIEQMDAARAAGRLDLPLSGHRYLYAVLASMADKREAAAERQQEEERRHVGRPAAAGEGAGPAQTPLQALQSGRPAAPPPLPGTTSPLVRRMREELARRGGGNQGESHEP